MANEEKPMLIDGPGCFVYGILTEIGLFDFLSPSSPYLL